MCSYPHTSTHRQKNTEEIKVSHNIISTQITNIKDLLAFSAGTDLPFFFFYILNISQEAMRRGSNKDEGGIKIDFPWFLANEQISSR